MTVTIDKSADVLIPGKIETITISCPNCVNGLSIAVSKSWSELKFECEGDYSFDSFSTKDVIEFGEAIIQMAKDIKASL